MRFSRPALTYRQLIPAAALGLFLAGPGAAARAQDRVLFQDRATQKEAVATGDIQQETPGRVVVKPTSGINRTPKEVAVADILDVVYYLPSLELRMDYRRALDRERIAESAASEAERKKALGEALKEFQDVRARLTDKRFAQRHLEFKIARLLAWQAEEDPAQLDAAIASLRQFLTRHPDGWQINTCARLLARLQMDKGDFQGAQKTYEQLAATPALPPETRRECDLLLARGLLHARNYAAAEKKLQELRQASPADDPQAARVQVYLAECAAAQGKAVEAIPQLQALVAQTEDVGVKALAYNALGDCYRQSGQPKEALFAYLWVDVVYPQDKQEHARALYHLAQLFAERGEEPRAQQCRERLEKDRRFAGTDFQKRALREK
jgi:tetratricopeptide (TPR) repeat protein